MSRYTIGTRLTVAVGAMAGAILLLGFISVMLTRRLSADLEHATVRLAREQMLAGGMNAKASEMVALARAMAFSAVLQQAERVRDFERELNAQQESFRQLLAEMRPMAKEPEVTKTLGAIEREYAAAQQGLAQVKGMLDQQQMDAALSFFDSTLLPRLTAIGRLGQQLVGREQAQLQAVGETAASQKSRNLWTTAGLTLLCGLIGAVALFAVRSAVRALRRITAQMSESAGRVSEAAVQISDASQSLAQGASHQAGSLEETSSASQEMSSMTQRNAENASRVSSLMSDVEGKITGANQTLDQMAASMAEIKGSSEKIARIIKVIDEISFQTNILALNAAVEAARAGEAGMGFAVVADEVRNLAQRCAQAARDTAGLIEDSIRTSKDGAARLNDMSEAMRRITESAAEVNRLVAEVSSGSQEQARGIDHVAGTLSDMERVTQQAAASAQQSASAASAMSDEANRMQSVVEELVLLVGSGRR